MITQPSKGDGEAAWRAYAAELRKNLGEAGRRIEGLKADNDRREELLVTVQQRNKSLQSALRQVKRNLEENDPLGALEKIRRRERTIALRTCGRR